MRRKIVFYSLSIVLALFIFIHLLFITESNRLYAFIKHPVKLSERLFKTHEQLGYSPIPSNTGYHTYNNGDVKISVPAVTDANGRRISLEKYEISNDSLLLFLGCSFTWADYSKAEESFAYLTAKKLKAPYLNAGVSGYGLAQMLILAKQLIPQKKPAYVVVQYAPWLVDRATTGFTPTFFGTRFSPYFATINGKDSLLFPPYLSYLDEIPFEYYKHSEQSLKDKLSFLHQVAFPVLFKPYIKKVLFRIKVRLGLLPEPNSSKKQVEKYFYESVFNLCKVNNCKMIVLNVNASYDNGYSYSQFKNTVSQDMAEQVVFADAHNALCAGVKSNEEYMKAYAHQKSDVIFDGHPNEKAAEIISETIINSIKK